MRIRTSKKSEGQVSLDSLFSPAYKESMAKLKAAFAQVEKVLDEENLELVLDARGDYMLTAIPKDINTGISSLSDAERTKVLDNSYDLSTPQHLITLLD